MSSVRLTRSSSSGESIPSTPLELLRLMVVHPGIKDEAYTKDQWVDLLMTQALASDLSLTERAAKGLITKYLWQGHMNLPPFMNLQWSKNHTHLAVRTSNHPEVEPKKKKAPAVDYVGEWVHEIGRLCVADGSERDHHYTYAELMLRSSFVGVHATAASDAWRNQRDDIVKALTDKGYKVIKPTAWGIRVTAPFRVQNDVISEAEEVIPEEDEEVEEAITESDDEVMVYENDDMEKVVSRLVDGVCRVKDYGRAFTSTYLLKEIQQAYWAFCSNATDEEKNVDWSTDEPTLRVWNNKYKEIVSRVREQHMELVTHNGIYSIHLLKTSSPSPFVTEIDAWVSRIFSLAGYKKVTKDHIIVLPLREFYKQIVFALTGEQGEASLYSKKKSAIWWNHHHEALQACMFSRGGDWILFEHNGEMTIEPFQGQNKTYVDIWVASIDKWLKTAMRSLGTHIYTEFAAPFTNMSRAQQIWRVCRHQILKGLRELGRNNLDIQGSCLVLLKRREVVEPPSKDAVSTEDILSLLVDGIRRHGIIQRIYSTERLFTEIKLSKKIFCTNPTTGEREEKTVDLSTHPDTLRVWNEHRDIINTQLNRHFLSVVTNSAGLHCIELLLTHTSLNRWATQIISMVEEKMSYGHTTLHLNLIAFHKHVVYPDVIHTPANSYMFAQGASEFWWKTHKDALVTRLATSGWLLEGDTEFITVSKTNASTTSAVVEEAKAPSVMDDEAITSAWVDYLVRIGERDPVGTPRRLFTMQSLLPSFDAGHRESASRVWVDNWGGILTGLKNCGWIINTPRSNIHGQSFHTMAPIPVGEESNAEQEEVEIVDHFLADATKQRIYADSPGKKKRKERCEDTEPPPKRVHEEEKERLCLFFSHRVHRNLLHSIEDWVAATGADKQVFHDWFVSTLPIEGTSEEFVPVMMSWTDPILYGVCNPTFVDEKLKEGVVAP